jgi:hypothetical protein
MDLRAYEQAKFELTDILRLKAAALSRDHDPRMRGFGKCSRGSLKIVSTWS